MNANSIETAKQILGSGRESEWGEKVEVQAQSRWKKFTNPGDSTTLYFVELCSRPSKLEPGKMEFFIRGKDYVTEREVFTNASAALRDYAEWEEGRAYRLTFVRWSGKTKVFEIVPGSKRLPL